MTTIDEDPVVRKSVWTGVVPFAFSLPERERGDGSSPFYVCLIFVYFDHITNTS